ncbi:MAG: hypothetical protein ACLKAK_09740 [Alkaliphilus sp.]
MFENDENEFEGVVEEEINMSINDFKFIYENVYVKPCINKTFIKQLKTKIEVWFLGKKLTPSFCKSHLSLTAC